MSECSIILNLPKKNVFFFVEFCDPCWSRWHSKGTLQSHKKQGLLQEATDESRPLEEDVTVSGTIK